MENNTGGENDHLHLYEVFQNCFNKIANKQPGKKWFKNHKNCALENVKLIASAFVAHNIPCTKRFIRVMNSITLSSEKSLMCKVDLYLQNLHNEMCSFLFFLTFQQISLSSSYQSLFRVYVYVVRNAK